MGDSRPSRDGITLHPGVITDFEGYTYNAPAVQVAMWEGLRLLWSYEPGDVINLHLSLRDGYEKTALRIPLTEEEALIMGGMIEKGGWGYYELITHEDDDRGAVHVSFIAADGEPTSLLWILDRERRAIVRKALNRFLDEPVFEE